MVLIQLNQVYLMQLNFIQLKLLQTKQQLNQMRADMSQDEEMVNQALINSRSIVYPTLNIYSSPRVFQQKIDHKSVKLCAYTRKIQATNMKTMFDQQVPATTDLRTFQIKDGLIYQLKEMGSFKFGDHQAQLGRMKILICVCMYNESKHAINLTLNGIYNNLAHLEQEGISSEEVAVVLLQDGILKLVQDRTKRTFAKADKSMIQFYKTLDKRMGKKKCDLQERIHTILDEIDNYSRKGMGNFVANNRDFPPSIEKNISLLYQNLWRPQYTDFNAELGLPPVSNPHKFNLKIFSCFKHLNGTKLSSHLWFFQGFCRYLNPEFVVLLDVGTKPEPMGIVNLMKGFSNKDVGGVTGLMSVDSDFPSEEGADQQQDQENCIVKHFFSIQKAQQYEYIISHFLDKNCESALGFLHVLPGAWSAYRYEALIKSQKYEPNLLQKAYFKMILNPELQEKDFREANMYLAQDRILSLGIYCQIDMKYTLKYVPDALAMTDPMKDHDNLMKQRRRWINSSMFAFLYVYKNYYFNAQESAHGFIDKYIFLNLSMIISLLSFLTSYITPSIYFYVLYSTVNQISPNSQACSIIARIVAIIYVMTYLTAVAGGLTGAAWTKHAKYVSAFLSIFTFAMWGLVTYNVIFIYLGLGSTGIDTSNFNQMSILVMSLLNLGCMFLVIFMHVPTHCSYVCKLILDQISYMAYQGAYSQTMVAHAFCNVDDVSWGTKGSTSDGKKKHEVDKVFFVSAWLFYNCLLAFIFVYVDIIAPQGQSNTPTQNRGIVLIIIGIYSTANLTIRTFFAVIHHFKWMFFERCCTKITVFPQNRKQLVQDFWLGSNKKYEQEVNKAKEANKNKNRMRPQS